MACAHSLTGAPAGLVLEAVMFHAGSSTPSTATRFLVRSKKVRDVVVACSVPPLRLTLAGFAEDAFRVKLAALRKIANKGKPVPKRVTVPTGKDLSEYVKGGMTA